MIHKLYGIFDTKAKCLVSIFMALSDAAANRTFEGMFVTVEDTIYSMHPEDFNLVKIADIDDGNLTDVITFGSEFNKGVLLSKRIKLATDRAELDAAYQHAEVDSDTLEKVYERIKESYNQPEREVKTLDRKKFSFFRDKNSNMNGDK